jgi:hypothetical protein
LKNCSFGGQFSGATLRTTFGDQLWKEDFENNFGEQLCEQLSGATVRRSYAEQLSMMFFGTIFEICEESQASD